MSATDFPDRGIIAEREWKESADGTGFWRIVYRVNRLPRPDYERGHACAVETQRQRRRYDGTVDLPGEWEVWTTGATYADAIDDGIGDTAFCNATSLHPWHARAVARVREERERTERLREINLAIADLGLGLDSAGRTALQREATERYHAALKRARIYSAAMQGKAPEHRIAPIRAEAQGWYHAEAERRNAELERLQCERARLVG